MSALTTVTKRDAVRSEIEGAISVLAMRSNYLAAEVLAQAANEVLLGTAQKHDIRTLGSSFISDYIKPEYLVDVKRIMKKTYNFLKHADRDAETAIDRYNPDSTIWNVFIASTDYFSCFGQRTLLMLGYEAWFISRFPTILREEKRVVISGFEQQYGTMNLLTRKLALNVLRRMYVDFVENEHALRSAPQIADLDQIES